MVLCMETTLAVGNAGSFARLALRSFFFQNGAEGANSWYTAVSVICRAQLSKGIHWIIEHIIATYACPHIHCAEFSRQFQWPSSPGPMKITMHGFYGESGSRSEGSVNFFVRRRLRL